MIDFIALPNAVECFFKKGDVIIEQGEKIQYVYYLAEGLIYRTIISETGDETIYDTKLGDNCLRSALGILYLFNDGLSYTNFIAKADCRCYKISKKVIMDAISQNAEILYQLVEIAMDFYNNATVLLQKYQQKQTVNRLCQFLLDQADRSNGKLAVRKACTNAEISRFLGVHQVTASRIIKCLKDEGIIVRCANGLTILNEELLKEYSAGKRKMRYS